MYNNSSSENNFGFKNTREGAFSLRNPNSSQHAGTTIPRGFKLWRGVCTDIGVKRTENQDAYGYVETEQASLFIVADGMGGARGGATASAIAVNAVARHAFLASGEITLSSLRGAIEESNALIFDHGRTDESLSGMGTTIVALAIVGKQAIIAHVGDSRIYRYRNGEITLLTKDHTLVQELVSSGAISPADAENHPIAHMLTRSLGPTSVIEVEVKLLESELIEGEKFLLCCDGLHNHLNPEDIKEILEKNKPVNAAKQLVDLANQRGGSDNITVQVIEVCSLTDKNLKTSYSSLDRFVLATSSPLKDVGLDIAFKQIFPKEIVEEKGDVVIAQRVIDLEKPEAATKTSAESVDSSPSDDLTCKDLDQQIQDKSDKEVILEHPLDQDQSDSVLQRKANSSELKRLQFGVTLIILLATGFSIASFVIGRRQNEIKPTAQVVRVDVEQKPTTGIEEQSTEQQPQDDTDSEIDTQEGSESNENELAVTQQEPVVQESVIDDQRFTSEEPSTENLVSSVVPTSKSSETGGWPATSIIPEQLRQEQSKDNNIKSRSFSEEKSFNNQPEVVINESTFQAIAKEIANASELSVPPPPQIGPAAEINKPEKPIDWNNEKLEIQNKNTTQDTSLTENQNTPQILSEEELIELVQQKVETRSKIADVDAKLKNYSLTTKADVLNRITEIEQNLTILRQAIQKVSADLRAAGRRHNLWVERKVALEGKKKDPIRLAESVALSNVQVKRKKESYSIASIRYLDTVEVWRENPSDNEITSKMSTLGRELKVKEVELIEAVNTAINAAIEQALFDISEHSIVLADLKRREGTLNRHIGLLQAFSFSSESSRMKGQSDLLNLRNDLKNKLEGLRAQISDDQEIDLRRKQAIQQFLLNSTQAVR